MNIRLSLIITLLFCLGLAMLLLDTIVVSLQYRELLAGLNHQGERITTALLKDQAASRLALAERLALVAETADADCLMLQQGETLVHQGRGCRVDMASRLGHALAAGRRTVAAPGLSALLLTGKSNYVMVLPDPQNPRQGVLVALSLAGIRQGLLASQSLVFFCLLINALVFTLVGFFFLNRLTVRPVEHLRRQAEQVSLEDGTLFASESSNTFHALSQSLNRMIRRIRADRQELAATVQALEQANKELARQQEEMIQAEKLASVGRLSAGLAHEIGNPLGILAGYLELLQGGETSDAERQEYLQRARHELARMDGIIHGLLDFARPRGRGRQERFSVHALIEELVAGLRPQRTMRQVTIETRLEAADDRVMADPDQLRQVLLNCVLNSRDALAANEPPGGLIRMTTAVAAGGGSIMITIEDNGPGIPPEQRKLIFEPFFTTKTGHGTGLGLSVSRTMVEAMGGRMRARSTTEGTAMIIELPLDAAAVCMLTTPAVEPN